MTDQRDAATSPQVGSVEQARTPVAQPGLSRRSLLRGAYVAVPTILTLNSGVAAAIARSSNLIGARTSGMPPGDKYCFDARAYDPLPGSRSGKLRYDLGPNPDFDVVRIPGSLDYQDSGSPGVLVSGETVCTTEGNYQYRVPGTDTWTDLNDTGKPSVLVSATALTSFAGRYAEIDIRDL